MLSVSCNTDSVKVCVGILWHVIVEHNIDTFNVHSSTKQIGGDKDPLLEVLKLLEPGYPVGDKGKKRFFKVIYL